MTCLSRSVNYCNINKVKKIISEIHKYVFYMNNYK